MDERKSILGNQAIEKAAIESVIEQEPVSALDFDSLTKAGWLRLLTELARAYKRMFGRTLGLTDELGELHACEVRHLDRASAGMTGYDAVDAEGRRVQIKTRSPRKGGHVNPVGRVGRFHSWDFDYALLVLLDREYRVDAILQAERAKLQALQANVRNPNVGITVSAFIRVADRVYDGSGWGRRSEKPGHETTLKGAAKKNETPEEAARRSKKNAAMRKWRGEHREHVSRYMKEWRAKRQTAL